MLSLSFVVFRLDSKNMTGFEWLLIHYGPEGATVKDRMLYASTRELLKRQLGASYFADELFASTPAEAGLDAYRAHRAAKSGARDVPLTATELHAAHERHMEVAVGTSKEYVHSVQFPLSAAATEQLAALAAGRVNFVLLLVEPTKETIELAAAKTLSAADLPAQFPADEPRFGLYTHTHENQPAVVFVYSCPNDSKVKLKMLYSTVKSAVLVQAEAKGVRVAKKLEIQNPSEASADAIAAEFGAADSAAAKPAGFEKPSRPGRGAPRLIRK